MQTANALLEVTGVSFAYDRTRMDRKFAGREFDQSLLDELPESIDPCAERGEFHTCSYRGPMFSRSLPIRTGITVERDGYVFTDLTLDG